MAISERDLQIPSQTHEIVEEVVPGIIRMTVENGEWSFGTPNFYLLMGGDAGIVIDSGTGSNEELSLFRKTLERHSVPKSMSVVVTHSHFDHDGGSREIAKIIGGVIIGGGGRVEEERELDLGGSKVKIIPTPGHTKDSLCIWDEAANSLFTGDTVIEDKSVVVRDMSAYLSSLQKLKSLEPGRILPGHGDSISNGGQKISEYIARTNRRERLIVKYINLGLTSERSLVDRMYPDRPSAGRQQIHAHIEKLNRDGRLITANGKFQIIS